ncbi:Ferrochelatase [Oligella ureolytica]|uniref:ferrochelatase n=1 Tax=Oligella ureolytica TaxID=90244 RepID=UPI000E03F027|nr:ferrochelatase [Oligella ureolytica]SUA58795.1 Ferrochelatase [Oligella ureolytica]
MSQKQTITSVDRFSSIQPKPLGVLLVNLGTPNEPTPEAVTEYLNEFLSDPKVVELPGLLWKPFLKYIVSPRRSKPVAENYKLVWQEGGSPLMVYTKEQAQKLQARLASNAESRPVIVDFAMRYGEPRLNKTIDSLRARGCEEILVMPMYPQFSGSTTGTILDYLGRYNAALRDPVNFRSVKHYTDHPMYINALAQSVEDFWAQHGKPDRLLLSYHGLPQSMVDKGDPYFDHCHLTTELLREALAEHHVAIDVSFQSRFGKAKWIGPSTEDTIREYPAAGVKKLHVMCPGFSVDCLETLEEIAMGCKDIFEKEVGGEELLYIPCLNAEEVGMNVIQYIVESNLKGWR